MSTRTPDHLAQVLALRRLHGHKHDRAAEVHEGCQKLESMTRSWCAFRPSPMRITDALIQAEGIAAALRSIRDEGGPPDEAA